MQSILSLAAIALVVAQDTTTAPGINGTTTTTDRDPRTERANGASNYPGENSTSTAWNPNTERHNGASNYPGENSTAWNPNTERHNGASNYPTATGDLTTITTVITELVTYCPEPTTFTGPEGDVVTVTSATTITVPCPPTTSTITTTVPKTSAAVDTPASKTPEEESPAATHPEQANGAVRNALSGAVAAIAFLL